MKKLLATILFGMLLLSNFSRAAFDSLKKGAELGKWTMDYEAALQLAKDEGLPIFLDFTGSDWCGWCKLMDRKVFAQKKWARFAEDNLVLVVLDFPRNSKLVPEKYKQRNLQLQRQFGVRGYPTYIILDADGKTRLGRLGANRTATPEGFIRDVQAVTAKSKARMNSFGNLLPSDQRSEFRRLSDELKAAARKLEDWVTSEPPETVDNFKKYYVLLDEVQKLKDQIEDIRIRQLVTKLDTEKASEYLSVNSKLRETRAEMEDWLRSGPERNDANQKKLVEYNETIERLEAQVKTF